MDQRAPVPPPDNSFRGVDPRFIEIGQPAERAYWCKVLDVNEDQLVALVSAVGPSAQSVKDSLAAIRAGGS